MADALVSGLVSTILGNLNSYLQQEFGAAWGLKDEIQKLKSTFTAIQAVLQDAEAKQTKNATLQDWLSKLKDAAYDADNLLDEFATEVLKRRVDRRRGGINQVSAFFTARNPFVFRLRMAHKVKDIGDRLDAIAGESLKFQLKEGVIDSQIYNMEERKTGSLVIESEIYGRNEEKELIIDVLLSSLSYQDDLSVYAIWGMGGLGKTTVSQLVYNDPRVQAHFEMRIWVCVSDDFSIQRLTKAIIELIEGVGCNISELDLLQRHLQERLRGRRFLLVLDDVWNEENDKWDRLKDVLRCGSKGSMLIVTTRIEKVARMMATLPIYHLGYLSDDDSWTLFKQRAFGSGREENLELETIGKAIVKKCGRVPLAVKALGSLMWFKSNISEWLFVKESDIWDLSDSENAILPILRLSYDNLHPYLRQCFAYCSIFPKDYEMEVDMLIELWMANSFIPSKGQTNLLLIARECFNDLVCRSFFQDVKENHNGDLTCKMHDLMHDLAQSIMIQECCTMEHGKVLKIPEKIRHLSFYKSSPESKDMRAKQSLRSFILLLMPDLYWLDNWKDNLATYISKQKYLRVLAVRGIHIEKLISSIGNLKHLRYLDVSHSDIISLPESTTCLQNLQTLKLRGCRSLRELPKGMKQMRNLICLDIRNCYSLTCMPVGLGQLTCLQTLSMFIVGPHHSRQISELKELNLGGELTIKQLNYVKNPEDARSSNLKRKHNLCDLRLYWDLRLFWDRDMKRQNFPNNVEEILDGLQPHSNLKKLTIYAYQGLKFPNWMLDLDLQNLVQISLIRCERCEHLPLLGKLPFLEVLSIVRMNAVKHFNNECHGDGKKSFPALEKLIFKEMPSLEEWTTTDGGESLGCLRELEITGCPKLADLPNLPALKRLVIERSNTRLFRSVMDLTSLSWLGLSDYDELEALPDGLLQNHKVLKSLDINKLCRIKILPRQMDNLSALKLLVIRCCRSLECLPEGLKHLISLEILHIVGCESLTSLPALGLQGLSSLRSLNIFYCKKLSYLSEGVKHLTALQGLSITQCPELTSLPEGIQHLNALQNLTLRDCNGLVSLPNGLGSLQLLQISGCPHLEWRCEEKKGEDWPKIAHVPKIWINDRQIQSLDC
ncbi:unnamed protein product [Ilex paraguariensis]|uniref:Disease resistance protein RGA3 n=1 Tax=Ilex paraguariensis TaxID=185542 RepID=A0ABC8SC31_9AQUA